MKIYKLLLVLALAVLVFMLFACGNTDESSQTGAEQSGTQTDLNDGSDKTESAPSKDDVQEENKPSEKTTAQKLSATLENNGYIRNTDVDGRASLENFFAILNQGGAVITVEETEPLFDAISEYYIFEKEGAYIVFADLGETGVDALCRLFLKEGVDADNIAQLEERGILYGNCMLIEGNTVILELFKNNMFSLFDKKLDLSKRSSFFFQASVFFLNHKFSLVCL